MNAEINLGVEELAEATLEAVVEAELAARKEQRLGARLGQRADEVRRRAAVVADLPEHWASSGMKALFGAGTIVDGDERVAIGATHAVGDVEATVRISIACDQIRHSNPWYGLEVRTPAAGRFDEYFMTLGSEPFPDITERVLKEIFDGVEKTRALRRRAAVVQAQARGMVAAWQAWDDACSALASGLTARLWEPVEMWEVACRARDVAGPVKVRTPLVVLEAPQDVAPALRRGQAALVTTVAGDGTVSERWLFAVSGMRRLEPVEATIAQALPYHRSYRVGRFWVNLPVTLPKTTAEEGALAPGSGRLSEVLGATNPAGRWHAVCSELKVDFWDEDERSLPQALAGMPLDDIVRGYARALAPDGIAGFVDATA